MKKIFLLSIISIFALTNTSHICRADEIDGSGIEDTMKYTNSVENAFAGQKQISDEEFQKTLEKVKAKQKKKKKDKPMKGSSIGKEDNSEYIDETAEKNLILTSPVELITDDGLEIPAGHYKIVGKKDKDNSIWINFYQSYTLVASVQAVETQHDFDEKEVNFVKLLPYNEQKIKIIYGSIDFNAYTFINLKQETSNLNN